MSAINPANPIEGAATTVSVRDNFAAAKSEIEALQAQQIPGEVKFFAMSTAPNGWLKADGSLISRTTYANLFAAIGTTFGAGDGSTTFAIPDLRAEFLRGWDDGRGVDSGRVFGSGQADMFAAHAHSFNVFSANANGTNPQGTNNNGAISGVNTTNAGGNETRPRNVALLACIKY